MGDIACTFIAVYQFGLMSVFDVKYMDKDTIVVLGPYENEPVFCDV